MYSNENKQWATYLGGSQRRPDDAPGGGKEKYYITTITHVKSLGIFVHLKSVYDNS